MNSALDALQARLTYTFRDPALLERAVTHLSYLPEHPDIAESNQRLEFLGDAVLQLVLTEALFQLFPGDREGLLSKRRASLTKGVFLVELARELSLDRCLLLGSSEESTGGRQRASSLEDAFEALVGALYLDSDLATARRIILSLYGHIPDRLRGNEHEDNPKGRLQERVQPQHGNHALRYEVMQTEGEDHARIYEVAVFLNDRLLGQGRGPSKKTAEEAAARAALETLKASSDDER
jgi:ribonuclease-3